MQETTAHPQQRLIDGLRDLARFIEDTRPSLRFSDLTLYAFADTKEQLADFARYVGRGEKQYVGDYFVIVKRFGNEVELRANIERGKVCRLVEKRTTKKLAAQPAQPEREVEVIEKEWECTEPLLS